MSVSQPKEKHETWLTTLEFQWCTPKRETAGEHDDHDIFLYHLQGLKLLIAADRQYRTDSAAASDGVPFSIHLISRQKPRERGPNGESL